MESSLWVIWASRVCHSVTTALSLRWLVAFPFPCCSQARESPGRVLNGLFATDSTSERGVVRMTCTSQYWEEKTALLVLLISVSSWCLNRQSDLRPTGIYRFAHRLAEKKDRKPDDLMSCNQFVVLWEMWDCEATWSTTVFRQCLNTQ